jgi:hypothetical protein
MKIAAVALASSTMLTACLCGSYEGQDDRVLRRDNGDSMILCGNSSVGYAVTLASGEIFEGKYRENGDAIAATIAETGARRFELFDSGDGTLSSPELGDGWRFVEMDIVELDKAHIQCSDLETRNWFASPGLPVATAFTRGDDSLLLCPDGSGQLRTPRTSTQSWVSYQAAGGDLTIEAGRTTITGVYQADRMTTASPGETWMLASVASLAPSMRCPG